MELLLQLSHRQEPYDTRVRRRNAETSKSSVRDTRRLSITSGMMIAILTEEYDSLGRGDCVIQKASSSRTKSFVAMQTFNL